MSRLLTPIGDLAAVYLHDELLHASTIPEALAGLEKVFQIIREEGLTLNLQKCSFLETTVSFLGFEISAGTLKLGKEKIKAVRLFPILLTVHQVCQFLGLTEYFRQYVKNYAIIAKPLTMLLGKNKLWLWTTK